MIMLSYQTLQVLSYQTLQVNDHVFTLSIDILMLLPVHFMAFLMPKINHFTSDSLKLIALLRDLGFAIQKVMKLIALIHSLNS